MSVASYGAPPIPVTVQAFWNMVSVLERISSSTQAQLDTIGLGGVDRTIAKHLQEWLPIFGVPPHLLEKMPAHERSRLEASRTFFDQNPEVTAKVKALAQRIFAFSKANLLGQLQDTLKRVEGIIETGPEPVGEDKETGGFKVVYQRDYDNALQRLPRLKILESEINSLTFDKLEGVITGPQTTVY